MVDPITKQLHQNLTPFDTANMVFHPDANAGNTLVVQLVNRGERPILRLLLRFLNDHSLWGKPLEPAILPQRTAGGNLKFSSSAIALSCFFD